MTAARQAGRVMSRVCKFMPISAPGRPGCKGNSLGGEQGGNLVGTGKVSPGTPTRLRSFDPVRIADLEYRAWVGYYLRGWREVLVALSCW